MPEKENNYVTHFDENTKECHDKKVLKHQKYSRSV